MKKTVTVNLDKTIFNIDDDAYTVLESYLEALHDHFKKEEGGQEIMNDIESRISELFKERLGFGMQVIPTRGQRSHRHNGPTGRNRKPTRFGDGSRQ